MELRAPGGVTSMLGSLGLLSMKARGSEEPRTQAQASGLGDQAKRICSCPAHRAAEPWAGSGPGAPLWAGLCRARRGSKARGGAVKSGPADMCRCPSPATPRLWHLLPHPSLPLQLRSFTLKWPFKNR